MLTSHEIDLLYSLGFSEREVLAIKSADRLQTFLEIGAPEVLIQKEKEILKRLKVGNA